MSASESWDGEGGNLYDFWKKRPSPNTQEETSFSNDDSSSSRSFEELLTSKPMSIDDPLISGPESQKTRHSAFWNNDTYYILDRLIIASKKETLGPFRSLRSVQAQRSARAQRISRLCRTPVHMSRKWCYGITYEKDSNRKNEWIVVSAPETLKYDKDLVYFLNDAVMGYDLSGKEQLFIFQEGLSPDFKQACEFVKQTTGDQTFVEVSFYLRRDVNTKIIPENAESGQNTEVNEAKEPSINQLSEQSLEQYLKCSPFQYLEKYKTELNLLFSIENRSSKHVLLEERLKCAIIILLVLMREDLVPDGLKTEGVIANGIFGILLKPAKIPRISLWVQTERISKFIMEYFRKLLGLRDFYFDDPEGVYTNNFFAAYCRRRVDENGGWSSIDPDRNPRKKQHHQNNRRTKSSVAPDRRIGNFPNRPQTRQRVLKGSDFHGQTQTFPANLVPYQPPTSFHSNYKYQSWSSNSKHVPDDG